MTSKKNDLTSEEIKIMKIDFRKGNVGWIYNQHELQKLSLKERERIGDELTRCARTNLEDSQFMACVKNTLISNKVNMKKVMPSVKKDAKDFVAFSHTDEYKEMMKRQRKYQQEKQSKK